MQGGKSYKHGKKIPHEGIKRDITYADNSQSQCK